MAKAKDKENHYELLDGGRVALPPVAAGGCPLDVARGEGEDFDAFRARIYLRGLELYRDLPWRRTHDPYEIWVSEAMLQQTQVSRVDGRWQRWLERFPAVDALAAASSADVLDEWQGLGYNRRALALWRAAQIVAAEHAGELPRDEARLRALPGIGPATAAGIRAFAFDLPGLYLETNVRAVFLHEFFPEAEGVPDSALAPLVHEACPEEPLLIEGAGVSCTPRSWYYALLDYGAYLKRTHPNPSRRSRANVRQSRFEGSHRQKRAAALRLLLEARAAGAPGLTSADVSRELTRSELAAARPPISEPDAAALLTELSSEGFCREANDLWFA